MVALALPIPRLTLAPLCLLCFLLLCVVSPQFVHTEMKAYRLYTVVPRLVEFIEQLTNCYVRLNRNRLKGSEGAESARAGENGGDIMHLSSFVGAGRLGTVVGPFAILGRPSSHVTLLFDGGAKRKRMVFFGLMDDFGVVVV